MCKKAIKYRQLNKCIRLDCFVKMFKSKTHHVQQKRRKETTDQRQPRLGPYLYTISQHSLLLCKTSLVLRVCLERTDSIEEKKLGIQRSKALYLMARVAPFMHARHHSISRHNAQYHSHASTNPLPLSCLTVHLFYSAYSLGVELSP